MGTNGKELWKSDGTTLGTEMTVMVNPSNSNYNPSNQYYWVPHYMETIGNTLYFAGNNGNSATELVEDRWNCLRHSDGSGIGTRQLWWRSLLGSPNYEGRAAFANNKLFFLGHDYYSGHPGSGYEPWVLDPANITGLNRGLGSGSGGGSGSGSSSSSSFAYANNKVSAGFQHTCAILDNGDLKCWG